jgi:hypothetical protein
MMTLIVYFLQPPVCIFITVLVPISSRFIYLKYKLKFCKEIAIRLYGLKS